MSNMMNNDAHLENVTRHSVVTREVKHIYLGRFWKACFRFLMEPFFIISEEWGSKYESIAESICCKNLQFEQCFVSLFNVFLTLL